MHSIRRLLVAATVAIACALAAPSFAWTDLYSFRLSGASRASAFPTGHEAWSRDPWPNLADIRMFFLQRSTSN